MKNLLVFIALFVTFASKANTADCVDCVADSQSGVSPVTAIGNNSSERLAMAVLSSESALVIDDDVVVTRKPSSTIPGAHIGLLCGAWGIESWDQFKGFLIEFNYKIKDIYHELKCDIGTELGTNPFAHAELLAGSYQVIQMRLMRQFIKEGGHKELTCALDNQVYENDTPIESAKDRIKRFEDRINTSNDPAVISMFQSGIKDLRKLLGRWEKHVTKHPVSDPASECPVH